MLNIFVILPSLFPALAERALAAIAEHGATFARVTPVVIGPARPAGRGFIFVEEQTPQGVNAAVRRGFDACTGAGGDAIMINHCDDAVHRPGWLIDLYANFLAEEQRARDGRLILGLGQGVIGTCWGHLYANFPMYRRGLIERGSYLDAHRWPDYVKGQWGDVCFSLAHWRMGGVVKISQSRLIEWAPRNGHPEAPLKASAHEADLAAVRENFAASYGHGWPADFRGFNIDAPEALLHDGTVCIPRYHDFMAALRRARAAQSYAPF